MSNVIFELSLHCLLIMNKLLRERKKIHLRRWWVRAQLKEKERERFGAYQRIFLYFKKYDHEKLYEFVGLTFAEYNHLFQLVRDKLEKNSFRKSLSAELKLSAVLNYLVHGGSVTQHSWFFLIGRSTMYAIIPEVCQAICEGLADYVKFPSAEELKKNADDCYRLYDFPNCIGIIDGKHVPIKAAPQSGSWFRNYKQSCSINLMAACDALGKIIWVSIGDFGPKNDAGNFKNSPLGISLSKNEVALPPARKIPNTSVTCPFFFIADGGFGLQEYMITPFRAPKTKLIPLHNKIFNIRLQQPRKTIERVFGIMCKRWKILDSKQDFKLKTIDLIVFTIVHLYNFTFKADRIVSISVSSDFGIECQSSDTDSEQSSTSTSSLGSDSTANSTSTSDDSSSSRTTASDDDVDLQNCSGETIRQFLTEYFMDKRGNRMWQWEKPD